MSTRRPPVPALTWGSLGFLLALSCPLSAASSRDHAVAGETRIALAADAVREGLTAVTVALADDRAAPAFELAHQLQYGAVTGSAKLRRRHWADVAAALATVPLTGPEHAERRAVDGHELLVRKVAAADGGVLATLYLPAALLDRQDGRFTLALESNPGRTRNATTEITTIPLRSSLAYAHQPAPERSVEGKLAVERTYISRRSREALRDENGDLVTFREQPKETIQDSQAARLELGTYWTAARGTRLGQVELGLTSGASYEQDELNLLDERLAGNVGGEIRAASETTDGRWLSLALRLGGSDETYLVIDPLYDEEGNAVGTTTTRERHRLPTWEVALAGTSPLYQLHGHTLARVEGELSLLRSFEASDGGSERPATTERRVRARLGLAFELPSGARIGLAASLESLDLPGEAGQRMDDLQWTSGATAGMTLRF